METRLVIKGKGEPLEGLIDQGRWLVRLARRFADELDAHGWSQDATSALDLGLVRLESEEARAVERMSAPTGVYRDEARAHPDEIDGALARDLVRRAAPKIAGYLERMRGAAAAIDERLAAGKKATAALDAAGRALERASAPTEVLNAAAMNAPAIHATKGRVLEMIETLNEVAARAFADRSDVRARFNLDLLGHARQARRRPAG